MDAMKLLLLLIVLLCVSSPAQAASAFRFLNPYSWFASSANPTPVQTVTAGVNSTQEIGNSNTRAKSVSMGQNSSHESSTTIPSHESVTVRQEKQERPDLIPTPLRIESLEIGDSDATGVQVIVPTHVAPLPSQIHSVRRFGMIREGDGQEGREEIELQTTTVTTAGEVTVSKEESERTSGTESVTDEVKTTRTEPTAPLISSTEAETPSSTLPPVTATTSEPGIAAFLVRLHESRTSRERHSNSGPAATVPSTMLTMKVVTVTEGTTLGQERSTSPSPVYIPSSPQKAKQVAFLFDDEFVRYLNRHYYSGSVFNSVVSRDLH